MNVPKIDKMTLVRTILMLVALVNTGLVMAHKSPIQVSEESVDVWVSFGFTVVTTLWSWWKDNPITRKARVEKAQVKR